VTPPRRRVRSRTPQGVKAGEGEKKELKEE